MGSALAAPDRPPPQTIRYDQTRRILRDLRFWRAMPLGHLLEAWRVGFFEHSFRFFDGHWAREKVALTTLTGEVSEQRHLFLSFNPFRYNVPVEVFRQVSRGTACLARRGGKPRSTP